MRLTRSIILFLLWPAAYLQAQDMYVGGTGNGSALRPNGFEIFLNGSLAIPNYTGGGGRGSQIGQSDAIRLNGGTNFPIYFGGIGNGSNQLMTLETTLNGVIVTLTYKGGSGRGDRLAMSQAAQTLNGGSASNLSFLGGSGKGDMLRATNPTTLNGIISTNYDFVGGIGRGNASAGTIEAYLSGSRNFVEGYMGGQGRGNFTLKSNSIRLNGQLFTPPARIAFEPSFLQFKPSRHQNHWYAHWLTKSLESNQTWIVESSSDGIAFTELARTDGKNQNLDGSMAMGGKLDNSQLIYFRLKEVTSDSIHFFSDVVKLAPKGSLSLQPNPVKGEVNLQSVDFSIEQVDIFSASGILIKQLNVDRLSKAVLLDLTDLPAGIYELVAKNELYRQSIRFCKE